MGSGIKWGILERIPCVHNWIFSFTPNPFLALHSLALHGPCLSLHACWSPGLYLTNPPASPFLRPIAPKLMPPLCLSPIGSFQRIISYLDHQSHFLTCRLPTPPNSSSLLGFRGLGQRHTSGHCVSCQNSPTASFSFTCIYSYLQLHLSISSKFFRIQQFPKFHCSPSLLVTQASVASFMCFFLPETPFLSLPDKHLLFSTKISLKEHIF